MLLFIDESGTDHRQTPYEVLAGVAVREAQAWPLIQTIQDSQLRFFGVYLADVLPEFKGNRLLKAKNFRLAAQMDPLGETLRRDLARTLLEKGKRSRETRVEERATRPELTAYAQASISYARHVLELCSLHEVRVFASIVEPEAPRPLGQMLRKDFTYLFERYFHSLDSGPDHEHGIVVFDELDVTASRRLGRQMHQYFRETNTGRRRAVRILPEPFFVRSDLTTLVQVADLVAYSLNWGWRLKGRMLAAARPELEEFGLASAELQYRGTRLDARAQRSFPLFGICHIRDLRPAGERTESDGASSLDAESDIPSA